MRIKFIACVICIFHLFTMLTAAASVPAITTNLSENSVVISGTLDVDRAKTELIVRLKDVAGKDILADHTVSKFSGGNVVYEFDKILLPKTLISGDYTFEISGEELTAPIVIPYNYVGLDKVLSILRTISGASDVSGTVLSYAEELSLDVSDYALLDEDGKELFETVISQVEYDLPDSYVSDEEQTRIKSETKKLFEAYSDSISIALFESIKDLNNVKAWIERYYETLGFAEDDNTTAYNEKSINSYLNTVKNDTTFVKKLANAESLDTFTKIKDYVYESALLSVIADKRSSVVKEMMLEFTGLFDFDVDALNALSVSKQSTCFTNITGKVYASYDEAAKALDDEIDKISDTTSNKSSDSSGSSRGSVSFGSVAPNNAATTIEDKFIDVPSSHWSYSAVEFLSERGIINGMGDGTFAPDANITRAEFIKMITIAMSLGSADEVNPFVDVPADAWYAPYAAKAYKEGIVLGDELGRFNPDDKITRQDMVTILYRAMKITDTGAQNKFNDAVEISDYAKSAVAYFSSKGIVNGMGDGSFAPKANATRAQAAKILHNIIAS